MWNIYEMKGIHKIKEQESNQREVFVMADHINLLSSLKLTPSRSLVFAFSSCCIFFPLLR